MTLTLLAFLILPLAFKMVLDPGGMHRVLKEWGSSAGLQFFSTLALLLLALLILTTSPVSFAWKGESLLSWLGVVIAIKGVAHLIPSVVNWKLRLLRENRLPGFGFLALVFALTLVYLDTQIL